MNAATAKFREVLDRGAKKAEAASAHTGLARIQMAAGQTEAAEAELQKAIKADPSFGEAYTYLGLLKSQAGPEKALPDLRKGAELAPQSFVAHFNLARNLARSGQLEEAVRQYEKAIALQPKLASPHHEMAITLLMLNRPEATDRAIDELNAALKLNPLFLAPLLALAEISINVSALENAVELLETALSIEPDNLDALELMASAYKKDLNLGKAVEITQRMLELRPDDPDLLYELSALLMGSTRFEESEAAAKRLTDVAPGDWRGHFQLAMIYDAAKLRDKARQSYAKAVAAGPDQWRPANNYGKFLLEESDPANWRQGIELLERARQLSKEAPEVLYNLALGHAKMGKTKEAVALARRVAESEQADAGLRQEAQRLVLALAG